MSLVDCRTGRPVAVITPNTAPINCGSLELDEELDEAVLRARCDDSVHVNVLTGTGDRVFCAGADIAMLEAVPPRYKYYFGLHGNDTLLRLEQLRALEGEESPAGRKER